MTRRVQLLSASVRAAVAVSVVVVSIAAGPLPALAADGVPSPSGPMWLTTDPPGTVHVLSPGETSTWSIDVTANVDELDSLLGRLSISGPLVDTGAATASVVTCTVPWTGAVCAGDERTVIEPTALGQIPKGRANLQNGRRPLPGVTHVQVRVTLARSAGIATAARTATAVLQVDASGQSNEQAGSSSPPGTAPAGTGLADTGLDVTGFAALALIAVLAGILIARAGARWAHRHDDA